MRCSSRRAPAWKGRRSWRPRPPVRSPPPPTTGGAGGGGPAPPAPDPADQPRAPLEDGVIERARAFLDRISVVPEGLAAARAGASAMHDVTEGGVLGGAG